MRQVKRLKLLFIVGLLFHFTLLFSQDDQHYISVKDIPELIDSLQRDSLSIVAYQEIDAPESSKFNYTLFDKVDTLSNKISLRTPTALRQLADSLAESSLSHTESLLFKTNQLLMPLAFSGKKTTPVWDGYLDYRDMLYGKDKKLTSSFEKDNRNLEFFVADLRYDALSYIANENVLLFATSADKLPDVSHFIMPNTIDRDRLSELKVYDDKIVLGRTQIDLEEIKKIYWIKKANAIMQFSQNHVSNNWHQGGNSNVAFLSILTGEINYDSRKNIQWENKMEWRAGYNRIQSEKALRKLNVNDDILRYNTKFGVKAGGNWYYSAIGEASTTLFNNYRSFDSEVFKARLLTPVRANVGIGMDYKYKKSFSMMVAPISFKYIYLNDTIKIDPNSFGLQKGENQLKQWGSSLRTELKVQPTRDWDLESRLTVYTDYKKVEADLEIVNNFIINRFMTTRLLINPRFDNTIILKEGEKSRIQFKELLSIGFSYRFL